MPRINLLPWRAARRKELQQEFIIQLSTALVMTLILMGVIYFYIASEIAHQNLLNDIFTREIQETETKIQLVNQLKKKIQDLKASIEIVQNLQTGRPDMVHLFDEVPRLLPDGVFFTSLKQNEQSLTIDGVAQSNAQVSSLMKRMGASKWLAEPTLDVIQNTAPTSTATTQNTSATQGAEATSKFTIHARQVRSDDGKKVVGP